METYSCSKSEATNRVLSWLRENKSEVSVEIHHQRPFVNKLQ